MKIKEFQQLIENIYLERDKKRGWEKNFMWLVEEVGEVSRAYLKKDSENLQEEFADVFAWLCSLASLSGIDMEEAITKYKTGCPRCHGTPCQCS